MIYVSFLNQRSSGLLDQFLNQLKTHAYTCVCVCVCVHYRVCVSYSGLTSILQSTITVFWMLCLWTKKNSLKESIDLSGHTFFLAHDFLEIRLAGLSEVADYEYDVRLWKLKIPNGEPDMKVGPVYCEYLWFSSQWTHRDSADPCRNPRSSRSFCITDIFQRAIRLEPSISAYLQVGEVNLSYASSFGALLEAVKRQPDVALVSATGSARWFPRNLSLNLWQAVPAARCKP